MENKFKVGMKVQRKKEYRDLCWNENIQEVYGEPDSHVKVEEIDENCLRVSYNGIDISGSWYEKNFDIVEESKLSFTNKAKALKISDNNSKEVIEHALKLKEEEIKRHKEKEKLEQEIADTVKKRDNLNKEIQVKRKELKRISKDIE